MSKRIGTWALRSLLVIAAILFSALVHFSTTTGRQTVRQWVNDLVSRSLQGRISVGEIERLTPWVVVATDVRLFDGAGSELVEVSRLTVEPDWSGLLRGVIAFERVAVSGVQTELVFDEEQNLTLLEAFASSDEESAPSGEGPSVRIDQLVLDRVGATIDHPATPPGLRVRQGRFHATIALSDGDVTVELRRLSLQIYREQANYPIYELTVSSGAQLEVREGSVALDGQVHLGSAADDLELAVDGTLVDPFEQSDILAELMLQPLSPELLRFVGQSQIAETVQTNVLGIVRLRANDETFALDGTFETEGGKIRLEAESVAFESGQARIQTEELRVHEVVRGVESLVVSGVLSLEVEEPREDEVRPYAMHLRQASIANQRVPDVSVVGRVGPDYAEIARVDLPALEDSTTSYLRVRGRYAFDGYGELHLATQLDLDEDLHSLPARGKVGANFDAQFSTEADAEIALRGSANASGFGWRRELALQSADLRLDIEGTLTSPEGVLQLEARGVRAPSVGSINLLRVRASGTPHRYQARLVARDGHGRRINAQVHANATEPLEIWNVSLSGRVAGVLEQTIDLSGQAAISIGEQVNIQRLRLQSADDLQARIAGTVAWNGNTNLRANIDRARLEAFAPLLDQSADDLAGTLTAEARVRGPLTEPAATIDARLVRAALFSVPLRQVEMEARADLRRNDLALALQAQTGPGTATVDWRSRLGPGASVIQQLESGRHHVSIEAERVSLEPLHEFLPADTTGEISITGDLRGTLRSPEGEVRLTFDGVSLQGSDPFDGYIALTSAGRTVDVLGHVEDGERSLLGIDAHFEASLARLLRRPRDVLSEVEWWTTVKMDERRLDQLPAPLSSFIDLPASGEATVNVARDDEGLSALVRADLLWDVPRACPERDPIRSGLLLDVAEPSSLHAEVMLANDQVVVLDAAAEREWVEVLESPAAGLPILSGELLVAGLQLSRLPTLCQPLTGIAEGSVTFEDLFGSDPVLDATVNVGDLRIADQPAVLAGFQAELRNATAQVDGVICQGDRLAFEAQAEVPLLTPPNAFPRLADGPMVARAEFDRVLLAPLLAAVPGIDRPRGSLSGEIDFEGTPAEFDLEGEIRFHDAAFSIEAPPQRFEDIGGRIRFNEQRIFLDDLVAHDVTGRVTLDGEVALAAGFPQDFAFEDISVHVQTDEFPLRRDGVIAGYLTTDAWIRDVNQDRLDAEVRIEDLSFRLPRHSPHEVQPLGQHPDVRYASDPPEPSEDEVSEIEEEVSPPPPIRVRIHSAQPFWVRRHDFAVQASMDLQVIIEEHQGEPRIRITGPLEVRRGFVELVGKSFDLQRGEIVFTGGASVDAEIDLVAVHYLDGRGGDEVRIHIGGHLMEPEISFSSTVEGADTAGEALALLVRGRGGSEFEAGDQAASFLTGLTAGLLTMAGRERFGGVVPVLALETGDTVGTGRLRAGFQTDRLIPDFLDEIVVGAYVEGFVGTTTTEDQTGDPSRHATGGFLIELLFPRNLTGTAVYSQPNDWSLDVMWEP